MEDLIIINFNSIEKIFYCISINDFIYDEGCSEEQNAEKLNLDFYLYREIVEKCGAFRNISKTYVFRTQEEIELAIVMLKMMGN